MSTFDFNVLAEEGGRVPIDIAGSVMVNVQGLLRNIGKSIIYQELRLRNNVPSDLLSRFTMYMDDVGMSVAGSTGPDVLLENALSELIDLLTLVADGDEVDILDRYPDPRIRIPILNSIISLINGLEELSLSFGKRGEERILKDAFLEGLEQLIEMDPKEFNGDVAGVLRKSMHGMHLETDDLDVALVVDPSCLNTDIDRMIDKPCVVNGMVQLSPDNRAVQISDISSIEELPYLSFEKVISSERTICLSSPLVANIDHDPNNRIWTLGSDPLGISVSKTNLDDAILEFHEDFIFMWEMYADDPQDDPKDELSDDEIEVRDYILSLS